MRVIVNMKWFLYSNAVDCGIVRDNSSFDFEFN